MSPHRAWHVAGAWGGASEQRAWIVEGGAAAPSAWHLAARVRLPAVQVDAVDDSRGTCPVLEGTALGKRPLALEAVDDERVSEHQPKHPHPPVRLLGGGAVGMGSWEEPSKVNGKTGGHSGRCPDRHSRPQDLGKGGEPVTSRGGRVRLSGVR